MHQRFNTFTVLISKISRCVRKIKTEEMQEFDLKSPHVSCLYYLSSGPMTAKELCEVCDEDKASISRSIEYLEKNGFIESDTDGHKRYKTPLYLTERGKAVAESIAQKIGRIISEINDNISDEDREVFYKTLNSFATNLQKKCDSYNE